MARTLGIPSRIAVGYRASSDQTEDGEYTVSNRQLHSWPELYIRGAGWVSFEPTPSSDAAAQAGTESSATPAPAPSETPLPAPGETAPAEASPPRHPPPRPERARRPRRAAAPDPVPPAWWSDCCSCWRCSSHPGPSVWCVGADGSPRCRRDARPHCRPGARCSTTSPTTGTHRARAAGDAAAAARTARAVRGRLVGTVPASVLPHLTSIVDAVDLERFAADGAAGVDTAALRRAVLEARVALDASVPRARVVRARLFPPSLLPSSAWSHEGRQRRRTA